MANSCLPLLGPVLVLVLCDIILGATPVVSSGYLLASTCVPPLPETVFELCAWVLVGCTTIFSLSLMANSCLTLLVLVLVLVLCDIILGATPVVGGHLCLRLYLSS